MNEAIIRTKNEVNYYFVFFILALIFAFFLNEFIGFNPLDELFQMGLIVVFLVLSFWKGELRFGKMGIVWLIAFLFYLGYSFFIKSNVPTAIFLDILLQSKPFLAFFCIYYAGQVTTIREKEILKIVVLFLYFISIVILIGALVTGNPHRGLNWFFVHPAKFATAITILSLLYLYTSEFTRRNRIIFILMLSAGLFSMKGKFYGFFAFSVLMVLIYDHRFFLKLSFRNLILGFLVVGFVFWAAQDKIFFYAQGFLLDKATEDHNLARPVLYVTSAQIMHDYFPFGSGFGSFATHASGAFYSKTYGEYEIDKVWGLSESFSSFIADTHFPSLAQFGLVSLFLFVLFWRELIKEANRRKKADPSNHAYLLIVLVFVFLMIEMVADAAFTNNRGFISMLFLGYLFNEYSKSDVKLSELKNDNNN